MTEQEAKRLEAIERVLTDSINRLEAGGASLVDDHTQTLLAAYDEGVKAGEAKGGYRAGFEAGQAAASKTIAESLASVIALRAIVDQCRAAGFIDEAGNVRKSCVRPISEYHEDFGIVAWWKNDFCEMHEDPYIGSPLDLGWPVGEYEWWSELPDFRPMIEAAAAARKAVKP